MLKRIGKDITSAEFWARPRQGYYANALDDSAYHQHRLRVVRHLLGPVQLSTASRCVDFGCGGGVVAELVARQFGASVLGLDPTPSFVNASRELCRDLGDRVRFEVGSVPELTHVPAESIDCLLAINVLHYFSDDEDTVFYRAAHRCLRPGGALVVTHSNELFDLFTLNAFTVDFFDTHFHVDPGALLTTPNEPDHLTYNIRENPLTYATKLAAHGFLEQQQEFLNYHPAPPSMLTDESHQGRDTIDWPQRERWKLLFMCSMFGSRAVRI